MARDILGFGSSKVPSFMDPLESRDKGTKRKKFSRTDEKAIFTRFHGKCAICGKKTEFDYGEVDHIKALASGGSNSESNLQWLCHRCNKLKGSKRTNQQVKILLGLETKKKREVTRKPKKRSSNESSPIGMPNFPKLGGF